jgi:hypothetical protein
MTQVDGKYILAAGQTVTATFTIGYPREDDVPVAGIWSIGYDPTVISVSCGGDESLSCQSHLVKGMTSSQTITLTIKGVSGGESGISASWGIWSNPTASPAWQFGISSGQSIDLAVVGAKIDIDAEAITVHENGGDDLVAAHLSLFGITPTAPNQVFGKLKASDNIQVWADPNMTTLLVPFGGSSNLLDLFGLMPLTVYIEGVAPGDAQLDFTVQVNGKDFKTTGALPVINLQELTVTDSSKSTNTVTVTDPKTPGSITIVEDARGFLDFGFQAIFQFAKYGKLVHWKVEQDRLQTPIEGTFANGNFISKNLKAMNGNAKITVWLDDKVQGGPKTLIINIVQPQVNISRIDTGMSDSWDAFKSKVNNATANNVIFYNGHCGPSEDSGYPHPYTKLDFNEVYYSENDIGKILQHNKASLLFLDGCATAQSIAGFLANKPIPVVIGTNIEIAPAWADTFMGWLFDELKKGGQTIQQCIGNVNQKITDIWGHVPNTQGEKPQLIGKGRTTETLQHIINNPK